MQIKKAGLQLLCALADFTHEIGELRAFGLIEHIKQLI